MFQNGTAMLNRVHADQAILNSCRYLITAGPATDLASDNIQKTDVGLKTVA